jgi:hypothetical protein
MATAAILKKSTLNSTTSHGIYAKNDHSRLLAKQKLMKLDRKNIHN